MKKLEKNQLNIILEFETTKKDHHVFKKHISFLQAENRFINFIMLLFKVANTKKWEKLVGQKVLLDIENNTVVAIGNYKEDFWLDFADFFEGE
jgi:hypothetical protein